MYPNSLFLAILPLISSFVNCQKIVSTSDASSYISVTISNEMKNWITMSLSNTNDLKIDLVGMMPSNYNSWINNSATWIDDNDNPTFGFNVNDTMYAPFSIQIESYLGQTISSSDIISERELGANGTMTEAFEFRDPSRYEFQQDAPEEIFPKTVLICLGLIVFIICCCIACLLYKNKQTQAEVSFNHETGDDKVIGDIVDLDGVITASSDVIPNSND